MEKILVNQFVCFQFLNESRHTDDTGFIKRKLSINAIVSHRAIHDVIVMCEVPLGTVLHHKIHPFFGSPVKVCGLGIDLH